MEDIGYASILGEAIRAPEDVSEIRDEEGRVAHIERDSSYPGAKRVFLEPPLAKATYQVQWKLPATSNRPEFYPPHLPFVPEIGCLVFEAEGRVFATWRDDACPRIEPEEAAEIRATMPEGLEELMSSMKEAATQGKGAGSGASSVFKKYHDRWSEDDVKEWVASMSKGEAIDPRFQDGFDDILRQCTESGWLQGPVEEEPPSAVRSASLRKDSCRRVLILSAMFGIGSLMLTEKQVDPLDSV